jgi:hypothetical protein
MSRQDSAADIDQYSNQQRWAHLTRNSGEQGADAKPDTAASCRLQDVLNDSYWDVEEQEALGGVVLHLLPAAASGELLPAARVSW